MAQASSDEAKINLATIQKTDNNCCEVLDKSTSTALYLYVEEKWQKCNCDGVFLLYSRRIEPHFAFIILNKRSTQNKVQYVTCAMGLQLQAPFLLYKTDRSDIHGVWFFNNRDCQRIAQRMGQLVQSLGGEPLRVAEEKAKAAAVAAKQAAKQSAGVAASAAGSQGEHSILQMLSKAQTDYQVKQQQQQQQQQAPTPVKPQVISVDQLFGAGGGQLPSNGGQLPSNGGARDQCAELSFHIKEQLGLFGSNSNAAVPAANSAPDSQPDDEEEFLLTPGMLEKAADQPCADAAPATAARSHRSSGNDAKSELVSPGASHRQQQQQQQQQYQYHDEVPALTKEQLRESLVYLLETDDSFLASLHSAYVSSLQRRLAKF